MTIALVAPDLRGRSGYSTYAVNLGVELQKQGHRVIALVHEKAGVSWCTELPILGRDTQYLRNPLRCFLSAKKMQRILQNEHVDIVHFIAEPYALTVPLMKKGSWKIFMTIHGSYAVVPLATGGSTRKLTEQALKQCSRIISVSNFTKNFLINREPEVSTKLHLLEKIIVIPNSVDLSRAASRAPRNPDDPFRIISVGAVKDRKGYIEALEACAAFCKKTQKKIQYDIIGPNSHDKIYTDQLRAKISALGLQDNVRLRGEVSDEELQIAYATADLFLLLSKQDGLYFEGFGLVFLEANAWGIPVIGPNTGGCPEAIDDGKSGYVCDPKNTEQVAGRMEDILLRHAINEEDCREWAKQFEVGKIGQRIVEVYQS